METKAQQKISIHIRWMTDPDIPIVLEIERKSFEFPWTEKEFKYCLKQRNYIGLVATRWETIVGFMIYEVNKTRIDIFNFTVHPDFRRKGVGAQMANYLTGKLHPERRTKIFVEVRETNLPAQLFFQKMGFRAICIVHNLYEVCPDEDTYLMQYLIEKKENPVFRGRNRISDFLI